jgi:hypothetical protein
MRYASSKSVSTAQTQPAATGDVVKASPLTAAKVQTPYVKSSPAGARAPAAQYSPELLKHVGTELKITLMLSGAIILLIIILYFVLPR